MGVRSCAHGGPNCKRVLIIISLVAAVVFWHAADDMLLLRSSAQGESSAKGPMLNRCRCRNLRMLLIIRPTWSTHHSFQASQLLQCRCRMGGL